MMKTAAFLFIIGSIVPANAETVTLALPHNTIDCAQFKKIAPDRWIEIDTAIFDLGRISDIHLTGSPITPGHFKFGGIDVYAVLENKCGAPEAPASEQAAKTGEPSILAMAQTQMADSKLERSGANGGTPPTMNEPGPAKVEGSKAQGKCDGKKSVYGADGKEANGKALVEIALNGAPGGDSNPGFIVRGLRNNEVEWLYRGKMRRGRLLFTYAVRTQSHYEGRFMLTSTPSVRQRSEALTPSFVSPNRDGTGEAILHVAGLPDLFAANARRFKFEGKWPSEALPEVFYFDRCE
jgi:hypothetical protein